MTVARRLALAGGLLLVVLAATAPVLAAEAAVAIKGQAFEPASITINAGDTVTWMVTESIDQPHSVTSGTPQDSGAIFDSGTAVDGEPVLQANGQSFAHTFNDPGEFPYYCEIHPGTMTGTVVVLAEGASAPPSSGEPGASVPPQPTEDHPPVAPERKVAAGAILAVALVLMFGMAWVWRRMNPA